MWMEPQFFSQFYPKAPQFFSNLPNSAQKLPNLSQICPILLKSPQSVSIVPKITPIFLEIVKAN